MLLEVAEPGARHRAGTQHDDGADDRPALLVRVTDDGRVGDRRVHAEYPLDLERMMR